MILKQIKTFLKENRSATIQKISSILSVSQEEAQAAVDFWIRKGLVAKLGAASGCTSCRSCTEKNTPACYMWIGN